MQRFGQTVTQARSGFHQPKPAPLLRARWSSVHKGSAISPPLRKRPRRNKSNESRERRWDQLEKGIFLTKGVGKHREKLASFEVALRDAQIAEFNIVRVSSILPPGCRVISIQDGLRRLSPGRIVTQ
jgi:Pyruvoyl-dependent arginine decarboxylase (PvlArgDC)